MKLSALTGPLGTEDNQSVELQVKKNGKWQSLGNAIFHRDAWTATFRIPEWDENKDTPYRVLYIQKFKDGNTETDVWPGIIQKNPKGEPLRLAALTCQNDYAFPYEPVAKNIIRMKT